MNTCCRDELEKKRCLNEAAWEKGYSIFPNIITRFGCKTGAEIGVAFGGHSEAILRQTDISKLYCVDPYKNFKNYQDGMNLEQRYFDALYEMTLSRLVPFGSRFEMIRKTSFAAAMQFEEILDFVYIDANHTYRGCLLDVASWFPKIKDGGIIGGHDYNSSVHPGVTSAVNDFFSILQADVNYEGSGCWWVQKKSFCPSQKVKLFWRLNILFMRAYVRHAMRFISCLIGKAFSRLL